MGVPHLPPGYRKVFLHDVAPRLISGNRCTRLKGCQNRGRKVWALARMTDKAARSHNVGGSKNGQADNVEGFMLLATSHDGSLQTVGQATGVRVVCWNTLSWAQS